MGGKSSSSSSYVEEPKEIIVVGGDFSSEISGDDVLFKGLWGLGLAEDSTLTDSSFNIVFTGIDYKVAWGFDVGNLTLTSVTINSNPIIFPTETPIDLNSWESAGVSVSLLDSGFTECGSYSFIVTVTASDGVHKYQRTEIIPFERDESYCVPCVDAALAQCPETLESNTICDNRDGKIYKTVTMGSQTWMAENLNFETEKSPGIEKKLAIENSSCYKDSEENCEKYGRLYTWTTAMGIDSKFQEEYADLFGSQRGICPEGFHIPSDAEVDALIDNLEDDANSIAEFGFTFSGKKFFAGFADLDREAYFWIADEDHSQFGSKRNAYILTYTETFGFGGGSMMKDGGYSIRCIKD